MVMGRMETKEPPGVTSSSSVCGRHSQGTPSPGDEILHGFLQFAFREMCFLQKNQVISLGPYPILNLFAEGRDIGEANQHIFIMRFDLLDGRFRGQGAIRIIFNWIMNEPYLEHFSLLLFIESTNWLWKLVVINTPESIVQRMNGGEVTVVVSLAMV